MRSRSHRSGGRFRLLPIPHYSRRTRGGARVRVGGCCLPLPLGMVGAIFLGRRLRG